MPKLASCLRTSGCSSPWVCTWTIGRSQSGLPSTITGPSGVSATSQPTDRRLGTIRAARVKIEHLLPERHLQPRKVHARVGMRLDPLGTILGLENTLSEHTRRRIERN